MYCMNGQFLDLDGGYDVSEEGEIESGMQRCLLVPCRLPSCGHVMSASLFRASGYMAAHAQLGFLWLLGSVVSLLGFEWTLK